MEINKSTKVIISILLIYTVAMLVIFLPGYLKKRREKLYILDSSNIRIKYENGKWSNILNSDDYKLKEFEVYENANYKGKYKVLYSNRFHLFDENGKRVEYDGQIFAYKTNLKINVFFPNIISSLSDDDKTIIKKALIENDLSSDYNFNLMQKVIVDINNDGNDEIIYSLNNYYVESNTKDYFSIIFIYNNGNIELIKKEVALPNDIYSHPMYELKNVFDIRNDGKYELMYSEMYFSNPDDECATLYDLNRKKVIHNFCE